MQRIPFSELIVVKPEVYILHVDVCKKLEGLKIEYKLIRLNFGRLWPGSALLAQACLSEYLG